MLKACYLLKTEELNVVDTVSFVCSECGKTNIGQILEKDKKVFLKSSCCEKIEFVDSDIETFKKFYLQFGLHKELKEFEGRDVDEINFASSTISLNVTFRCNLSCPICYLNNCKDYWNKKDPTLSQIFDVIERTNSKVVILCGAEPTIRDDLFDIITFIRKKRKLSVLATNGLRLFDRSYVKKLKKAGIWRVYLQFDGFDRSSYKSLRNSDLLQLKLKVLKNLREEGIDTSLAAVIGGGINENQIYNILKFAAYNNEFIDCVTFLGLNGNGKLKESTISLSDLYKLLSKYTNIPLDYLEEFKRMKVNMFNLIGKLFGENRQNAYRHLLYDTYYFKIENKKLKPIFSLKKLKKMNGVLEKFRGDKKHQLPFDAIKNINDVYDIIKFFAKLLLPLKVNSKKLFKMLNSEVIELNLTTPSPYASGTEVFKHNSIVPFVVSDNGDESKPEITRDQDSC
jgi:uncharacterized radical SAM superfamily Fe-S cluster-containing enzyme